MITEETLHKEKTCLHVALVSQLACIVFCVLFYSFDLRWLMFGATSFAMLGFLAALNYVRSVSSRTVGGKALLREGFDAMIVVVLNFAMFCCAIPLVDRGAEWFLAAYLVGASASAALLLVRLTLLKRG